MKKLLNYKLASFFTDILRDKIHLEVILNSSEPVSLEEIKEDVNLAVEFFLMVLILQFNVTMIYFI